MREIELEVRATLRVRIPGASFAVLPDRAIERAAVEALRRETSRKPITLPGVGTVAVTEAALFQNPPSMPPGRPA